MREIKVVLGLLVFLFGFCLQSFAEAGKIKFESYHSPEEVNIILKGIVGSNSEIARLHKIAVSPGGRRVNVLELGPETGKKKKSFPSIFVAANMEGTIPIATEAALYLARSIIEQPEVREDKTWYILPVGNPDAAAAFSKKPLHLDSRNARPYNDDMDDRVDEDGVEDLDGNGIITMMRVKDPEGQWIPVAGESRLMKKADGIKGEKGIYTLYTEGIDNDNDGKYNEDGPGGVNIGINFPHLFKFFSTTGGSWAGSEEESFNLFKFIFERPEIAMTICFGETNFCMIPPRGGRKGTADFSKIKIPKMIAKRLNFDPDRTYTMKEIMEKAREVAPPGFELTENIVASFLGLGAAVNPQQEDLKFYNEISGQYKEFLKENKLDAKRLEPAPAKDGSFELWSYYHLGLPGFSLDFWTLPRLEKEEKGPALTPEKLESMSSEDFLALGEEKIDAFLKASGAPENIKGKMVMDMVKNGMMTTKKMAAMMRQMPKPKSKEGADPKEKALLAYSDKELKGKGFIPWKPFKHPGLGEVEIGGLVPFAANTPPPHRLDALLKAQVPWVFQLAGKLPRIKIAKTKVKPLGSGLYRVNAWVENCGYLPYPTAMGKRNKRIPPVVISLKGNRFKIIEGKKRLLIDRLKGQETRKVHWLIHADQPIKLDLEAFTPNARRDVKQVILGGAR